MTKGDGLCQLLAFTYTAHTEGERKYEKLKKETNQEIFVLFVHIDFKIHLSCSMCQDFVPFIIK